MRKFALYGHRTIQDGFLPCNPPMACLTFGYCVFTVYFLCVDSVWIVVETNLDVLSDKSRFSVPMDISLTFFRLLEGFGCEFSNIITM